MSRDNERIPIASHHVIV